MAATHQSDLAIFEDLTPYAGSWVAIRAGKVIASALDAVELRDKPEVHEDDVLMPIPTGPRASTSCRDGLALMPSPLVVPYSELGIGGARPYLFLHLTGLDGSARMVPGLIDSGADSTVLPAGYAPLMGYSRTDLVF